MDLKVTIEISDELADELVKSTGQLDLASGEIRSIEYEDYDVQALGIPGQRADYEFTSGLLTNAGKDVEFRVDVDRFSGAYSITPSELLELKVRAAKLFAGIAPSTLAAAPAAKSAQPVEKAAATKRPSARSASADAPAAGRTSKGDMRHKLH